MHNLFYKMSLNKRLKCITCSFPDWKQKEAKNVHKNALHCTGHRTSESRIERERDSENLKGWNSGNFSAFSENLRFHSVYHLLTMFHHNGWLDAVSVTLVKYRCLDYINRLLCSSNNSNSTFKQLDKRRTLLSKFCGYRCHINMTTRARRCKCIAYN